MVEVLPEKSTSGSVVGYGLSQVEPAGRTKPVPVSGTVLVAFDPRLSTIIRLALFSPAEVGVNVTFTEADWPPVRLIG